MPPPPKLSICIPTFNRSHLLQHLLASLITEIRDLDDLVEVVISDNCSDDETSAIVDGYRERLNLVYHRNNENKGAAANILSVTDHASGLYCWILGDDDLLVPGSIRRVVDIIDNHGEVLGIVTGYSYEQADEKSEFLKPNAERDFGYSVFRNENQQGLISRWEHTILLSDVAALHTSIVSCVFRLSLWKEVKEKVIPLAGNTAFTSVENTFPHTVIWANMFTGQPVYLLSAPQVYFFVGEQEWLQPKWSTILFTFCLQLPDLFRACGSDPRSATHYESCIFNNSEALSALILHPNEYSRRHFSLTRLLSSHGDDPRLLACFTKALRELSSNAKRFRLILEIFSSGIRASPMPHKALHQFTREVFHVCRDITLAKLKWLQ